MSVHPLLQCINAISPISAESQEALCRICLEMTVKKNAEVQSIGHTCRTLYFIESGALRIFYFKDGVDITESFEFENAFVARAESLFSGKPSQKGIQAVEDSNLIAINSTALFKLFDSYHDLERLFRKIIEQSYVNTVLRLESLQFYTAEERYFNLLKTQPNVLQRVPLKYISSFLGITPVSLSRIRAKKMA